MGHEGRRPARVEAVISGEDKEKHLAMARAGGKKAGEISRIEATRRDAERDMHEDSMHQAAEARRDDELPEDF